MPRVKHLVQILLVANCGMGGFSKVATFVNPPIDFKAIALCGGCYELPNANRSSRTVGNGWESAFDHRNIHQVLGEIVVFKLLSDVRLITSRSLQPFLKGTPSVGLEILNPLSNSFVVSHWEIKDRWGEAIFFLIFLIMLPRVGFSNSTMSVKNEEWRKT